ncbi:DUF7504 family protein [Halorarum halobium]|uniref:DUF7504 family protein n=1 Tax=Halorarum halobium TaxID=3075121 RepID=UPI0028ADB7E1|nr:hypothetical protein [Halobaculum sp. XH14]
MSGDDSTDGVGSEDETRASLAELADSVSNRSRKESSPVPSLNLSDSGTAAGDSFEWVQSGDDRTSPPTDPTTDVGDESNVLVLGPLTGADHDRHCTNLLSSGTTTPENVLFVTLTRTATERWNTWRRYTDEQPANLCVLSVGERTRGATRSSVTTANAGSGTIRTETLSDASDLTRLGIKINKLLKEWSDSPGQSRLCLHSLTELLQYTDPQRLFRFVHVLQGRVDSLDATAHYHLYPDAHDDQTVAVFRTLFDTVARVTEGGELVVESGSD